MASQAPKERLVVVDMGYAPDVAYPDSFDELPNDVADSNETARWSFAFSVSEAAFLAGIQADFLRPL
ncbi:MAG: hypothetical protein V3U46_04150 [Acidimicrobiia bacterium]